MRPLPALAVVAVAACHRAPEASTDPAVLRGAMWYWQEGPTDGRVCLDPRALPARGAPGPPARWADSVLAALLADSLVALDSTAAPVPAGRRRCAPGPLHPRVTYGVPRVRGDSADLEMAVFSPAVAGRPACADRFPAVLARHAGRWYFAGRPDQHFRVLSAPPGA